MNRWHRTSCGSAGACQGRSSSLAPAPGVPTVYVPVRSAGAHDASSCGWASSEDGFLLLFAHLLDCYCQHRKEEGLDTESRKVSRPKEGVRPHVQYRAPQSSPSRIPLHLPPNSYGGAPYVPVHGDRYAHATKSDQKKTPGKWERESQAARLHGWGELRLQLA